MQRVARTMLILLVFSLVASGILMLYSTSYAAFNQEKLVRQASWILLSAGGVLILRKVDYHILCRNSWIWILLIGMTLGYLGLAHIFHRFAFPFTGGVKGAYRWLIFGPIRLQPSEFAKIAIILFLAHYYAKNARFTLEFMRGVLYPMAIVGAIMGLVLLGGSLSVTVITGSMVFFMAFIAGVRLRYLAPAVVVVVIAVVGAVHIAREGPILPSPERAPSVAHGSRTGATSETGQRLRRIRSWLYPEEYQKADGYQLWNSFLALGSGGWHGLGPTNSRMKQRYLPEAHTDFIVSVLGEELGFVAVLMLVVAYLLLTFSALWMAGLAVDREGSLICSGVGLSLGLHAFVNIGVVTGFLPTTGVTAPFVSYGGSNILASGIGVGLVLSVSRISEQVLLAKEQQQNAERSMVPPPLRHLFQ